MQSLSNKHKVTLTNRLSKRLNIEDIKKIVSFVQIDEQLREELHELALGSDDKLSINALWIMTHFSKEMNKWLYHKQPDFIDKVLVSKNSSQKRLLLALIHKQPITAPINIEFLDYCLNAILLQQEACGIISLCIKLAYEMCKNHPELLQEYQNILNMMDPFLLPPSLQAVRKNMLTRMHSEK